ncbi:ABC transporter ATP-binding protein [Scatolibacter rhodanostii]|uniref:ABC transporter ATP-binding protein n=1 Tax=Scatolibacter rhodanostii TaxID=2014781 RepID=UPI000C07C469|nr:ABC transporter ATP-binding protein [Scatolibacter rhodanostii]
MNNIIEIDKLKKQYDGFALNEVSFHLQAGYIGGFVGPNGAGKTTTIKAILGIIRPDSGQVKIMGEEVKEGTAKEFIGVVMDNPFYVEDWRIKDVEAAVSPFYSQWNSTQFHSYLKQFHIQTNKKVKELSRGMKVKLQMAVALSHGARLLVLDEPTSGLDPVARDEICGMLQDFVSDENHAVLFSTHITADLEKIADFITFISDGEIWYSGTKDELLEKYVRISGNPREIPENQKARIIGYREHSTGFEGMIQATDSRQFSSKFLIEPVTLDEIIIFINKGRKNDE